MMEDCVSRAFLLLLFFFYLPHSLQFDSERRLCITILRAQIEQEEPWWRIGCSIIRGRRASRTHEGLDECVRVCTVQVQSLPFDRKRESSL